MQTFTSTLTFVVEECYKCHVPFGLQTEHRRKLKSSGETFYCPNGHGQVYVEADKVKHRRQVERLEAQRDSARQIAQNERERRHAEERRVSAYKGQLTRMRNRVAKGLCPKQGCKRSFTQLHDHIATCHPELVDELA